VLERSRPDPVRRPPGKPPPEPPGPPTYAVRHLVRWPLRTPYAEVASDLAGLFSQPPLSGSALALDRTGVGAAVLEIIAAARPDCRRVPVLITAGHQVNHEADGWHVPKKELVSALQVLLQTRRLKVAKLPLRDVLLKELENFKVKVTAAANETFEAWRERDNDDLVLATALAAWLAERTPDYDGSGRPSVWRPADKPLPWGFGP
jgi:hypothetical protein